jgi:hypothetical protein
MCLLLIFPLIFFPLVFMVFKIPNGKITSILEKLSDRLRQGASVKDVDKILSKKFRILSENVLDHSTLDQDIRIDPENGTAFIVNESGILNYAFYEKMNIPLDRALNTDNPLYRSYKWNNHQPGNHYLNCYFLGDKLIGFGYTFYPLNHGADDVRLGIADAYKRISDFLHRNIGQPKKELSQLKRPLVFINGNVISSLFLSFCGATLFLLKQKVLTESFIKEVSGGNIAGVKSPPEAS